MRDLSTVREGWDSIESQEIHLLRCMSVYESIGYLLALQRAFEYQLQQTETFFRSERLDYLQNLQARLQQFSRWDKERRGESTPVYCQSTETAG